MVRLKQNAPQQTFNMLRSDRLTRRAKSADELLNISDTFFICLVVLGSVVLGWFLGGLGFGRLSSSCIRFPHLIVYFFATRQKKYAEQAPDL